MPAFESALFILAGAIALVVVVPVAWAAIAAIVYHKISEIWRD